MDFELPHYIHTVEVSLENSDRLTGPQSLAILFTALFQWMRVGEIVHVDRGPARGDVMLRFDVKMNCPPHELHGAVVHMRVSDSRRVEDPSA